MIQTSVTKETFFAKATRRVLSLLFGAIFLFELLNYLHIFHYTVDYTWFGRFLSTLVVLGVLRIIDEMFRRMMRVRLDPKIWVLMALLLALDFLGDVFHFYTRWEWYDQVVHFSSGIVLVASLGMCLEEVARWLRWNIPISVLYTLVLGINVICAVLYEIEEYSEDFFFHTHRLGDGPDTANDLLLNLVAGSLTLLFLFSKRAITRRTKQLT